MPTTLGPSQGRGPWLVIREIGGRTQGEQEFNHIRHVGPRRPSERRRAIFLLSCIDGGACVQQNLREGELLSGLAAFAAPAQVMEERLPLPIWQIRIHATIEQNAEHFSVFQEIAAAS